MVQVVIFDIIFKTTKLIDIIGTLIINSSYGSFFVFIADYEFIVFAASYHFYLYCLNKI